MMNHRQQNRSRLGPIRSNRLKRLVPEPKKPLKKAPAAKPVVAAAEIERIDRKNYLIGSGGAEYVNGASAVALGRLEML